MALGKNPFYAWQKLDIHNAASDGNLEMVQDHALAEPTSVNAKNDIQ